MNLGNGTGGLKKFIPTYRKMIKSFGHAPLAHPVILVIDNDDGAGGIVSVAKGNGGPAISLASNEPFYYLFENLYLVKTPEMDPNPQSCIEDFFDPELFKTEINGKTFDSKKKHGAVGKYGKHLFAEKVIKPKADTIDFSGFAPLLDRIVGAIQDYGSRNLPSAST